MLARLSLLFAFAMFLTSGVFRVAKPAPPAGGLLVVANQKEHTLLLVDPENRRELAKIVVGVNGHEVMASKDGRFAYVPIYGNSGVGRPGTDGSTIDVIDLQGRKLAATIDLGKPLRPHRAEFGPDGLLYVTAELAMPSALLILPRASCSRKFRRGSRNPTCWLFRSTATAG